MELTVSGRNFEVTEAIREYAASKAGKLPRYYDRIHSIDVVSLRRDSHHYEVEAIVKAEHAEPFVARADGHDLYTCIDDVVQKLERQLTDHKERLRNRKHNG